MPRKAPKHRRKEGCVLSECVEGGMEGSKGIAERNLVHTVEIAKDIK